MATISEITFGARLSNAENLLTLLQSFTAYAPPTPDLSSDKLKQQIEDIKSQNTLIAGTLQAYSVQVETRQQLFSKKDDSIIKLMSPIAATVRSAFGKTSKQAADISATVTKIRGVKIKKTSGSSTAVSVSQSEKSYGSITQNFSNIITVLETFDSSYNPSNPAIKLSALKDKLTAITNSNNNVATAYGKLKETRDGRSQLYKNLTNLTQRIKDAVKSQYGNQSSEYKLVKGLKI